MGPRCHWDRRSAEIPSKSEAFPDRPPSDSPRGPPGEQNVSLHPLITLVNDRDVKQAKGFRAAAEALTGVSLEADYQTEMANAPKRCHPRRSPTRTRSGSGPAPASWVAAAARRPTTSKRSRAIWAHPILRTRDAPTSQEPVAAAAFCVTAVRLRCRCPADTCFPRLRKRPLSHRGQKTPNGTSLALPMRDLREASRARAGSPSPRTLRGAGPGA